ncbi:hypothetical protein [Rhodococcus sp. O3]|uniref:hypothetical protein n=1 Tax=Rhodococcus sp. O3 TaxID=3404919 RepID=UPI003B673E85
MNLKKMLAGTFLTTTLLVAPASIAAATPAVDPSPGVTAVQPVNHNPYDRHDKDRNDWNKDWNKKDRDRGRDWDRGWNNRWDNPWRADCFWFGPWLVCSPW